MAFDTPVHAGGECPEVPFHLVRLASDDELHRAVGEVANPAADAMLARDTPRRHAKADALHRPPVVNAFADRHIRNPKPWHPTGRILPGCEPARCHEPSRGYIEYAQ